MNKMAAIVTSQNNAEVARRMSPEVAKEVIWSAPGRALQQNRKDRNDVAGMSNLRRKAATCRKDWVPPPARG
jgi:hypothetical protein